MVCLLPIAWHTAPMPTTARITIVLSMTQIWVLISSIQPPRLSDARCHEFQPRTTGLFLTVAAMRPVRLKSQRGNRLELRGRINMRLLLVVGGMLALAVFGVADACHRLPLHPTSSAMAPLSTLYRGFIPGLFAIRSAKPCCGAPPSCGITPALYIASLCEMPAWQHAWPRRKPPNTSCGRNSAASLGMCGYLANSCPSATVRERLITSARTSRVV